MKDNKATYDELLTLYENQNRRFKTILKLSDLQSKKLILMNEEKSNFLANMSHELRTPLNAIIGFSQILQKNKNIEKKHKNYIEKINSSGNQLLKLINSILDLSKIEAGEIKLEKREFDLFDTIDVVINQIELKAKEKDLKIIVTHSPDVHRTFNGDSLRISQILTNLVNNAVKFTDKGSVTINIIKIKNNRYKFEVKDTGIGLSEEQKNKLFQPFTQADESTARTHGGTGLGLTISKELVKLMKGVIWIETKLGVGSNFIFEIDLEEENKNNKTNDRSEFNIEEKNMAQLEGKKILIVEDNKTNQFVLISILEDSGLNIDIANNGQEAIDKFSINKYELIFMDLQMPILDGYEASKIIRETDKSIPIIALTANVMKEDITKTKSVGIDEHLKKPIEVDKLYKVLFQYIK